MSVDYNYKKGIDNPIWQWMAFSPVPSYPGTSSVYDGARYIYYAIQSGSTSAISTTGLYRYDTWSNGWQFIIALTSGGAGMDLEYDATRNVLYILTGATTVWQIFNLNTTSVTVINQVVAAWSLATITTILPITIGLGGSLTQPSDAGVPAQIDAGVADVAGNTTTVVKATDPTGIFGQGMINLQLRVTSGAQSGQKRTISVVTDKNTLTVVPALPGALASGDTFVIELVSDVCTSATVSSVTDSTATWTVNAYASMDVTITAGLGIGQRRRIASNTATVLTLAAAVTGNTRTGNFTTAPDATSTFKIVPSQDFLYYQPGGSMSSLYRIDVAATTGTAWSAALATTPGTIGGGGNTFYPAAYAPYQIVAIRGNTTSSIYLYNIGTNVWTTLTTFAGGETFLTGSSSTMATGKRKLLISKEGTSRLYAMDMLTGILEPAGTIPYAPPTAYDGKRARVINTPDGAQFLYFLRAGGQEFFRVPLEWL